MIKFKEKLTGVLKIKALWVGAASFMLPALVLYVIYACNGVHPFGNRQIIVTDFWHQYYPFLCELQAKLKEGASLLYSENIGMGINFWALIAYYCASPLNILIAFVSKENLRDLLTVIVALKVGFSGLFFSLYLKKVFKRFDFTTIAFSSLYALCGYVLGYYWNIMWLDCVALLPLVMLGVYLIIKENKCLLYIISLAVCVISNFYIGFMVCIFTAIYFFYECVRSEVNLKNFFKKLGIIALSSVIGLALTAFITIPAYNALGYTVSVDNLNKNTESAQEKTVIEKVSSFADTIGDDVREFFKDAPEIIGRTISFNEPVPKTGLPNIFSGFVCIVLLGYFYCSKNIKLREKIASSLMLLLLLVSLAVNDIDLIWHGMHKPNMVPYRYAFVFSFALIIIAYSAFVNLPLAKLGEKRKKPVTAFWVSAGITLFVILCGVNKDVTKSVSAFLSKHTPIEENMVATLIGCAALAILYHIIIYSMCTDKINNQKKWTLVLCSVIILEVIINTVIAVPTVRTTTYSSYYYRGEEIEALLDMVDAKSTYGRVETSQEYILNDPALYGYKGVSAFTSTANANVSKFMEKMGICGIPASNRYYYETTSPLTNSALGIEYVIFRSDMKNLNPYLEEAGAVHFEKNKTRDVIYKNTESLPMGFWADKELLAESLVGGNPFEIQNDLFRKLTGLEGELFTRVPLNYVAAESNVKVTGSKEGEYTISNEDNSENPVLKLNYIAPDENSVYAYIAGKEFSKVVVSNTTYKAAKRNYIFPAGKYSEGDKFTFDFTFENSYKEKTFLKFHVYSMNDELFREGMEILRKNPFEITNYKQTLIEGDIEAENDGVFYISIPYEKGWSMFVDGVEVEITPFENALISANLSKGKHQITLKYSPEGFKTGVIISVLGLAVLVVLIILNIIIRRRKKYGQNINSSTVL